MVNFSHIAIDKIGHNMMMVSVLVGTKLKCLKLKMLTDLSIYTSSISFSRTRAMLHFLSSIYYSLPLLEST